MLSSTSISTEKTLVEDVRRYRSSYSSADPRLAHLKSVPVPGPSTLFQRISQSLPLPIHLIVSSLFVWACILLSVISHCVDGPLRPSWNLLTSMAHATLKSILEISPPQGKHAFDIIRYFTSFPLPLWLSSAQQEHVIINVENPGELSRIIIDTLELSAFLNVKPIHQERRSFPGEWIIHKSVNIEEDSRVILYLHGGAHIFMSPNTHRFITTKVSLACQARVLVIDYRLAPENPFPAAIEDALAAYMVLIGASLPHVSIDFQSAGTLAPTFPIDPTRIIIAGDSSGCALSLQLLHAITKLDLPMPAGLILMSPYLDLSLSQPSFHRNYNTDFMALDYAGVTWANQLYANGVPLNHAALFYPSVFSYPPILIQSGDAEIVVDDAREFSKVAIKQGNTVHLQIFEDMFHVFHTFPFIRQSREAFVQMGLFSRDLGRVQGDDDLDLQDSSSESSSVE